MTNIFQQPSSPFCRTFSHFVSIVSASPTTLVLHNHPPEVHPLPVANKELVMTELTVWSPWLKKDIELLECTQDRALRLGNTNHVYETLEERRNRAQLMDTYEYLNNYYITPPERFFKKNGERARGQSETIQKIG